MSYQAEAVVDLDAMAGNVEILRRAAAGAAVMPVLKADAYGHGLIPSARACVEGGADALGVATLDEAMRLRRAGVRAPVLAWLFAPGLDLAAAADAEVELGVSGVEQLREVCAAGASRPARIHLKADTGMGRSGAAEADWGRFAESAAKAQADGRVEVLGAWSHLACADEPGHPLNDRQRLAFERFLEALAASGLRPPLRHLANSAGLLTDPRLHYDLVRPGIAVYGYPPVPGDFGLRPTMTLRTRITLVKTLPAGHAVGYGATFVAEEAARVGLAPLGYGDGVPRGASGKAEVVVAGRRCRLLGRVSMDQSVVDLSEVEAAPGDPVEFFGPDGVTAEDWARWQQTISYEILTRIGPRAPRRYVRADA